MPAKIHRDGPPSRRAANHLVPAARVETGRVRKQQRGTVARPFPDRDLEVMDRQKRQTRLHSVPE